MGRARQAPGARRPRRLPCQPGARGGDAPARTPGSSPGRGRRGRRPAARGGPRGRSSLEARQPRSAGGFQGLWPPPDTTGAPGTHPAPFPGRTGTPRRTCRGRRAADTGPARCPPPRLPPPGPYRLSKAELSWAPSGPLGTIPTQIWCFSMTCGFSRQTGKGLQAAGTPVSFRTPHRSSPRPRPGGSPAPWEPRPAPGRLTSASPGRRTTPGPACRW